MITREDGFIKIDITEDDLIRATAHVTKLRDYMKDKSKGLADDLTCALESMEAFWYEHFGEEEET